MDIEKLKVEYVDINTLLFADYNPRKASKEQTEQLKESIKRFGLVEPVVVNSAENRKNIIIGGHFRVKVAKELGIKQVPVVYVNIPDIEKEKELNIRLNKNTGEFDYELLANFDENLLKDIGFTDIELDQIFTEEPQPEDDEVPEMREVTNIKYGDIFRLGNHRLMCGDATKKEDVEKLMDGKKADMVFTDPPYGINLNTDYRNMRFPKKNFSVGKLYPKVIGDDKQYNPSHIFDFFAYCKEIFLWGADYYAELIPNRNKGSFFVWDKTGGGVSPNTEYEKMYGSNFELCWSRNKHKRAIVRVLWKGIFGLEKEHIKERLHPTQKPVALCEWFIKRFSKRGQIIVDLYGGSGSTLIACEKLNCRCYMTEIDPIYCQIIIDRWEKLTGKKAEKL